MMFDRGIDQYQKSNHAKDERLRGKIQMRIGSKHERLKND